MPNHIHGIIFLGTVPDGEKDPIPREGNPAAADIRSAGQRPPSLGDIVRHFKGSATSQIRAAGSFYSGGQPNYYEHIIRNDQSLERIRAYIAANPKNWADDEEHPEVATMAADRRPPRAG